MKILLVLFKPDYFIKFRYEIFKYQVIRPTADFFNEGIVNYFRNKNRGRCSAQVVGLEFSGAVENL